MSGVTYEFSFGRGARTRKTIRPGKAKAGMDSPTPARTPRVSKLMALAIEIDRMVRSGEARDFAEVALWAGVTRARMSQITNLLNLAPDLQELLLTLPAVEQGRDPIAEHDLRAVAGMPDWSEQRRCWNTRVAPPS